MSGPGANLNQHNRKWKVACICDVYHCLKRNNREDSRVHFILHAEQNVVDLTVLKLDRSGPNPVANMVCHIYFSDMFP